MKTEPNETAYPSNPNYSNGLTKREYFAAMAMQGIAANTAYYNDTSAEEITGLSVKMADNLINALNK